MKAISRINFQKVKIHKIAGIIWVVIRFLLLIGLSFMIVYPVFVKFVTSVKSASDLADASIVFLPKNFNFNSYKIVFKAVEYPLTFLKTIAYTSMTSALQVCSCMLAAYGLARFQFKGRQLIFAATLFTLIVPPQTMMLPLYMRFKYFSIFNLFQYTGHLSGMDLTAGGFPFPLVMLSVTAVAFKNGLYIFMLRQYYKNMPVVLEEAAYIDGCGPFKTFFKIMLPGSLPMIVTIFLFSFVWQWNDTFYVQTLAPKLPTLVNKMFNMSFNIGTGSEILDKFLDSPKFFLLVTPLIILYIFAQRFFTQSIEKSGIVG